MKVRKIGEAKHNEGKALIIEAVDKEGKGRRLFQVIGSDLLPEEIYTTGEAEIPWLREEDLRSRI